VRKVMWERCVVMLYVGGKCSCFGDDVALPSCALKFFKHMIVRRAYEG